MVVPVAPEPGPPVVRDKIASIIRTVVPTLVGAAIAWLLSRGFDLTAYSNAINAWLVPVCIAGYYTLVRLAEARFPAFGWLLGLKAQPKYVTPAGQPIAPAPVEPVSMLAQQRENIERLKPEFGGDGGPPRT